MRLLGVGDEFLVLNIGWQVVNVKPATLLRDTDYHCMGLKDGRAGMFSHAILESNNARVLTPPPNSQAPGSAPPPVPLPGSYVMPHIGGRFRYVGNLHPTLTPGEYIVVALDHHLGSVILTPDDGSNRQYHHNAAMFWGDFAPYPPHHFPIAEAMLEATISLQSAEPTMAPRCECGSSAVGSNKHSSYCPLRHLE